jgi:hypothetical protein
LAAANLANTNKELKPISDVECHLKGSSFSMVNGALMAKGGQHQVNESVGLRAVAGTGGQMQGRKTPVYCDFAVLGPNSGEFLLHACLARGTKANLKIFRRPTARGFQFYA